MAILLWLAGLTNLCLWSLWLAWVTFEIRGFKDMDLDDLGGLFVAAGIVGPVFLISISVETYLGIGQMADFLHLPKQLEGFSVRAAQCACCQMNHQLPDGERILCDRRQIFATLQRWFRSEEADPEHHLDRFDSLVRTELALTVRKALGAGIPPLRYVVAMLLVPPLALMPPYLHLGMHGIMAHRSAGMWWEFWQWVCMPTHALAMTFWIFWLCMFSWKVASSYMHCLSVCKKVFLLFFVQIFGILCGWLPLTYASHPKLPQRLLPATFGLWLVVVAAYCWTYVGRGNRVMGQGRQGKSGA